MNVLSRTSELTITEATTRSTASLALESTQPLSDAPAGKTTARSAPRASRASHSAPPEKVLDSMIRDISGLTISGLSTRPYSRASLGLTHSLASRLAQRASGSILYALTWKIGATPSGLPIYRLRASPRGLTYDSAFTGWPTATTPSGGQTWPEGTSATGRRPDGSKATVNLEQVARLAGWPTAAVTNAERGGMIERATGRRVNLQDYVLLAGWATAMADSRNGKNATAGRSEDQIGKHRAGQTLIDQIALTGWATTTTTRDHRSDRGVQTSEELYGSKGQPLARQALYSDATGSSVTTPASGLLNPAHSRWLLRIPAEWVSCGDLAMRSISKRR